MVTFRNNNNRRNSFRRSDRNFKSNGDRPKFGSNFSNNENFNIVELKEKNIPHSFLVKNTLKYSA